jgi:hypothetical protein
MSKDVLDPNEEILPTGDMGGYELPPLGSLADGKPTFMEFTGQITNCGENNMSLGFELVWVEDHTRKAYAYYKTTTKLGCSRILGMAVYSGALEKINNKRIAAGKQPIAKVVPKIIQDKKFQEQLRQEIEGCVVACTVTHSPAEAYIDKETGERKEGFAKANIVNVEPAKDYAATKGNTGAGAQTSAPTAVEDDEGDWDL